MPFIPYAVVDGGGGNEPPPDLGPPPVAGYTVWYDGDDPDAFTLTGAGRASVIENKGSEASANNPTLGQMAPYLAKPYGIGIERTAMVMPYSHYDTTYTIASDMSASYFVVGCLNDLSGTHNLVGATASGALSFRVNVTTGQLETDQGGITVLGVQSNAAIVAGVPFVATCLLAPTTVTQYVNLTSETDGHGVTFTGGRSMRVGADFGGSIYIGWMAEVVMYDSTLSTPDAESVITHLMTKWGIS